MRFRTTKVMRFALYLWALLAAGQTCASERAVTVQSYQFTVSVECKGDRQVEPRPFSVSVRVPLGDADRFFSPPWPQIDRYSINGSVRSTCDVASSAFAQFEVRNIDETGYVLMGEVRDVDGDGPRFSTAVVGDDAELTLAKGVILRVHRIAKERQVYPNAVTAINALWPPGTSAY